MQYGNIPPLRVMPKSIDAACYNTVSVALKRLGEPLRLDIPDHRGLEAVLRRHLWLCVDATRDDFDFPVLGWGDFQVHSRSNLHQPIACQLALYHWNAGLVMGTALESFVAALR